MAIKIVFLESDTLLHDRTGMLDSNGQASWTLTRNQRGTANLPFQVEDDVSWAPRRGWPTWIYDPPTTCVWLGTISTVQIKWPYGNLGQQQVQVTAIGAERMFDSIQTPVIDYPDGTNTGTIFAALLSYAISVGLPIPITLGTIGSGVAVKAHKYDGKTSVGAALTQLAGETPGYVQYIDPSDQKYYFHLATARAAPFTIANGKMLMGSITWKGTDIDFRDVQVIQMVPNIAPADVAVFAGNGATTSFTLPKPASQVLAAAVVNATANVHAGATGNFSGQPTAGDTFTIGGRTYTFVSALDNTAFGQVLIGANVQATTVNASNAIANGPGAGTKYSLPTWTNPKIAAAAPTGSPPVQFAVSAKVLGSAGNDFTLAATGSAFSWSASTLGGGQDISGTSLRVGPAGSGSFDLEYNLGSDTVTLIDAHQTGKALVVTYQAAGSDLLAVANGASVSLGVQSNFQVMTATNVKTLDGALGLAKAALAALSKLPAEVQWEMDVPGISIGRYVPISITVPDEADVLLNGNWIVQQVTGHLPEPKWEKQPEPFGHFRYQLDLINDLDIGTPQDLAARLAATGPNATPVTSNPSQPPTSSGPAGLTYLETEPLLIKDTTVGNDIADRVPILTPLTSLTSPPAHAVMNAYRIVAVPRISPTADLTVRIRKVTLTSPPTIVAWTMTVPSGAVVGTPLVELISGQCFDLDTLIADVLASDGAKNADGICSFFLQYM